MKIEKVSKYVPVQIGVSGNRASSNTAVRHTFLSLPRVKWLERPGPPTEFYHTYQLETEAPKFVDPQRSDDFCEKVKKEPFTDREQIIRQMLHNGATYKQIAEKLSIHPGTVPALVTRVRLKETYQAWVRSET